MKYKVGDRVKIRDYMPGDVLHWNLSGKMDKWLGQTMTIREISGTTYYKMEEDILDTDINCLPGWDWFDEMIEGLAEEEESLEFDNANNEVLDKFILSYTVQ